MEDLLRWLSDETEYKHLVLFDKNQIGLSQNCFHQFYEIGFDPYYFAHADILKESYIVSAKSTLDSQVDIYGIDFLRSSFDHGLVLVFVGQPDYRFLDLISPDQQLAVAVVDSEFTSSEMYNIWNTFYSHGVERIFVSNSQQSIDWKKGEEEFVTSVILPVYNVANYLPLCLDNLLATGSTHFQILCIDDGSTDNSKDVIREYTRKDSRVVLIEKTNGGCASARKLGFDLANSTYVSFVDPDDFTSSNYVDRLTEAVLVGDFEVAQGSYSEFYQDTGISKPIPESHLADLSGSDLSTLSELVLLRNIAIWRCIFKKSFLIEKNISFNVSFRRFDDLPFHFEVFSQVKRIKVIPDVIYFYRLGRPGQDISFSDSRLFIHFDIFHYLNEKYATELATSDLKWLMLMSQLRTNTWAVSNLNKSLVPSYVYKSLKLSLSLYVELLMKKSCLRRKYSGEALRLFIGLFISVLYRPMSRQEDVSRFIDRKLIRAKRFASELSAQASYSFYRLVDKCKKTAPMGGIELPRRNVLFSVPSADLSEFMSNLPDMINMNAYHPASLDSASVKKEFGLLWGIKPTYVHLDILEQCVRHEMPLSIAEDGFIRSVYNYNHHSKNTVLKSGISYIYDYNTCYYDSSRPSSGESILNSDKGFSEKEIERARLCIAAIQSTKITKYNFQDLALPEKLKNVKDAVLVVEQTGGDMSLVRGGASSDYFLQMLSAAIAENAGKTIIVKVHPDNINRRKTAGSAQVERVDRGNIVWIEEPVNPYTLFDICSTVYVATSQLGFEALMANKKVVCFGAPFYAGWGVTDDRKNVSRRSRVRSVEEIFYVFYIMFSVYFNPSTKKIVEVEEAMQWIYDQREALFKYGEPLKSNCVRQPSET